MLYQIRREEGNIVWWRVPLKKPQIRGTRTPLKKALSIYKLQMNRTAVRVGPGGSGGHRGTQKYNQKIFTE